MKTNKKLNAVPHLKLQLIIPSIILLVAIVIGIIFGFNLDYDFREITTFNVKFNTTVSKNEYDLLEKQLDSLLNVSLDDYRIERIGEGSQNSLIVKIADKDVDVSNLKSNIEDNLLVSIKDDITSDVVIRTTDTLTESPIYYTNVILLGLLALGCVLIYVFIYTLVRYNLSAGISLVSSILITILLSLSLIALARIPVNRYSIIAMFLGILLVVVSTTVINNYIKATLNLDSYNKFSNFDRCYEAIKKVIKGQLIVYSLIISAILLVMFFGNLSLVYVSLACLVSTIIAFVVSLIYNTTIWAMCYKKDKDFILRKRIENEKLKSENSNSEEKIVV